MLLVKKQAGIVFSYNPRKLDVKQKISIKPNVKTLADFIEILKKEILDQNDLIDIFVGLHLILEIGINNIFRKIKPPKHLHA